MSDGEPFGKYQLLRRLAFGGMAEIFLAAYRGVEGFEKRVVVKRILPQFSADPTFVRMFIDEAVLAARLTHANVVQVYDFGSVDGTYYIAMEWVDGVDLRRVLRASKERRRRLEAAEVAAIGEGVARGLAYAHAVAGEDGAPLGLVHRDVSPHNIMISRSGEPKIMDFGIAKAAARASHTATGTIKGKVAYMAPEQASGEAVDARCDQFALGLVLWECLTGDRLFQGDSDLEVLRRVVSCATRPVRDLRGDVPVPLEQVVMRMLSQAPAERFASLDAAAEALASFRFSLGAAGAVHLGRLLLELAPTTPELPVLGRRTLPLATPTPDGSVSTSEATMVPPRRVGSRARRTAVIGGALMLAGGLAVIAWAWLRPPPVERHTSLQIDSTPVGAQIWLDGVETGLSAPTVIPGLARGRSVSVELRRTGYQPWRQTVELSAPQERLVGSLVALPPIEVAAATTVTTSARPPGRVMREPDAKPRAHVPGGYLSLRSTGDWFEVYLGSRKLGETPLQRVPVPAGRHELHLVNKEAGLDQRLEVEVPPKREVQRTVSPRAVSK